MPADYTIDNAHRVVFSRAWGVLTDDDLLEHQRRLKADPAFDPSFNQLFDFRAVTESRLTSEGIRLLARRNAFGAHAKRAFVVLSPVMFGMMRMFEILTADDPDELRVQVNHIAEAYRWLELEEGNGFVA